MRERFADAQVLARENVLRVPGPLGAPLAILVLPMFDTTAAVVRRKLTGRGLATADRGGALDRLTDELGAVAPTRARQVLLVGWVFPSFLQGVAGFGVPVVVAAPMLVRLGLAPVASVATCLVGYHWSVTFGSMGSSFFIAVGTANLDQAAARLFAIEAAALLAISAAVTGAVLLRRAGGLRTDGPRAAGVAAVMGLVLVAVAAVQPAFGSTAALSVAYAACMMSLLLLGPVLRGDAALGLAGRGDAAAAQQTEAAGRERGERLRLAGQA